MQAEYDLDQPALPGMCSVSRAIDELSYTSGDAERGAVFTRKEVVDFILDLAGYLPEQNLFERTLLEPSFGGGDFLLAAVDRLLEAWSRACKATGVAPSLDGAIRGVELHDATFQSTRKLVQRRLIDGGLEAGEAGRLTARWLIQGDFLLANLPNKFDVIVGNPPYVRQELIPPALLQEYRKRYATMFDRADLYVPFIERSLRLLGRDGLLCFICADRWTKNKYGGPLRALVASEFHLRAYVDMSDTAAFHSDVVAYPAITLIQRGKSGTTYVAHRPEIDPHALRPLARALSSGTPDAALGVDQLDVVTDGSQPWILGRSESTDLVRRIEATYPPLEALGVKVGIGVATGADKAFIGKYDELDVEEDRKLPLAMTRDISTGRVAWRGYGVINPFTDEGPLVDLKRYPLLAAYLHRHEDAIRGRHVAKKDSTRWFRTIDRITPSLARTPKLLIPDIKGDAQVVYEAGELYPHHNLYFLTSDTWNLHALQAVLLSDLTRLFIATYSTKMRGGFLRFQAQYLRRLRLPLWDTVSHDMRERLVAAAVELDLAACNAATADLYQLTAHERIALTSIHGT